ncbi:sensor histidine kinase [Candidatus Riflebacteria bacterium]
MLDNLLELSAEEESYSFDIKPNDLLSTLNEVILGAIHLFSAKKIKLDFQIPDFPLKLSFDAKKIARVFINLFDNAIKYSPENSEVFVSFSKNENEVMVHISDQGICIPEDELESIFEKFTMSSRTDLGAGGTGLGLSVCKDIIEKHSGRIWAENNRDQGSTFFFTLPW